MSSTPTTSPSTSSQEDLAADSERSVASRYAAAAQQREAALCCPVTYDAELLANLPAEIIEKDYGCGDPSAFVRPGDVVLDLGSGGGKLCYLASQIVGETGRVIGVDCNRDMLSLARKYQQEMSERLGFGNVEFRYGRIQDLGLDLEAFHQELQAIPETGPQRSIDVLNVMRSLRQQRPMIADNSIDCVISNCVLNLVHTDDRKQLFREIFRVLKRGGRAAISDIVSDEDVPTEMQQDGHLWSGCISGAWREDRFVDEFTEAGFYGVHVAKYQEEPWQVINGIEFRSATVMAFKGKQGPCLECHQAVIYKGPFSHVKDDDGHIYRRGERTAVCDKTFRILMREPYAGLFLPVEPKTSISPDEAAEFDCQRAKQRLPRETKGLEYNETRISDQGVCDASANCC